MTDKFVEKGQRSHTSQPILDRTPFSKVYVECKSVMLGFDLERLDFGKSENGYSETYFA